MEDTKVKGAVRIGRTGTKLHTAYATTYTDARGRTRYHTAIVTCGCAHSSNRIGGPAHTFIPGATATCRK